MTFLIIARDVPVVRWRIFQPMGGGPESRIYERQIVHRDLTIKLCDVCGSQVVDKRRSRTCSNGCTTTYWNRVKEEERIASTRPLFWQSFRAECLARDKYTCQDCGATGANVDLHVHHIKPLYQGGTNQLENLTTLCQVCHTRHHATRPPVLDAAQKTMEEWIC